MMPGIQSWDQFHISQLDLLFFGHITPIFSWSCSFTAAVRSVIWSRLLATEAT